MPTGAFNICCPRDCVSRHKGGTAGAPLKPLRDDSALRRAAKNNMFISDEHKYRGLCNQVKRSSRQDKENRLNNKCEEIENSAQELKSRKTYMLIKDVNKG